MALGEIYDAFYAPLYRYLYHHLRHKESAEDFTAEVFERFLESIKKGRGPDRHLRAWLYRVAHNLVVDEARRYARRKHEPLEEGIADDEQNTALQAQRAIQYEQARAALDRLTPQQRAVIVLKFFEGLKPAEIAQVLETSVGAVRSLQHRALASMRRQLIDRGMVEGEVTIDEIA